MSKSASIWAVAVVAVVSAIIYPAANRFAPAPENASTATNTSVDVIQPLSNGLLGLLLFLAAVLTVGAIITGGEW